MEQRFPYTIYRFSILISKWTLTTFYLSFCASETDIMACGACKNMRTKCKDDCCFAEFFAPEDANMFGKLKPQVSVKFMRKVLSDTTTTKEYKKQRVQAWKAEANAKGKEKQAGSSSSKTEEKELQASKCQTSSSTELGCKETCLCAALFSPESKNKIDEIIKEQGLERVKTEVMLVFEKVSKKSDDEVQVAAQILLKLKEGNQQ